MGFGLDAEPSSDKGLGPRELHPDKSINDEEYLEKIFKN